MKRGVSKYLRKSTRLPKLIPLHTTNPPRLYCDPFWLDMGFFQLFLFLYTKTCRVSHPWRNCNRQWTAPDSADVCIQSRCSVAQLLRTAQCVEVRGVHNIGLRGTEATLMKLILEYMAWYANFVIKRNYFCSWVILCVLFRRVINMRYWSSVAMIDV